MCVQNFIQISWDLAVRGPKTLFWVKTMHGQAYPQTWPSIITRMMTCYLLNFDALNIYFINVIHVSRCEACRCWNNSVVAVKFKRLNLSRTITPWGYDVRLLHCCSVGPVFTLLPYPLHCKMAQFSASESTVSDVSTRMEVQRVTVLCPSSQ